MRLRALPSAPPRFVTIAAIDEASLAKLGRWPWSRTTFAALAERLDQLGARVIAFDLFFLRARVAARRCAIRARNRLDQEGGARHCVHRSPGGRALSRAGGPSRSAPRDRAAGDCRRALSPRRTDVPQATSRTACSSTSSSCRAERRTRATSTCRPTPMAWCAARRSSGASTGATSRRSTCRWRALTCGSEVPALDVASYGIAGAAARRALHPARRGGPAAGAPSPPGQLSPPCRSPTFSRGVQTRRCSAAAWCSSATRRSASATRASRRTARRCPAWRSAPASSRACCRATRCSARNG